VEKVPVSRGRSVLTILLSSKLLARPRPDVAVTCRGPRANCSERWRLPAVSSCRAFSLSSRSFVHDPALREAVARLFLLFRRLRPFLLTAVRFHRVVPKCRRRRPFLSHFFFPSPHPVLALHEAPSFCSRTRFIKRCARGEREKRERMIEKYRSLRRFTFLAHLTWMHTCLFPDTLFSFLQTWISSACDSIDLHNVSVIFAIDDR